MLHHFSSLMMMKTKLVMIGFAALVAAVRKAIKAIEAAKHQPELRSIGK